MLKSLPCLASLRRRPQLPQRRPLLPSPPRQPLVLLLRPRRRLLRSRVEESRQDTLAPLRLELPKPPLLGVWPLSVLKIAKSIGAAAGLRGRQWQPPSPPGSWPSSASSCRERFSNQPPVPRPPIRPIPARLSTQRAS